MPTFAAPTREVNGALQAVPTSTTAITAHNAVLYDIQVNNPTAGDITLTVSDGQGSPVYLFNAYSVIAGTYVRIESNNGIQFTTGIKWSAGGSGLTGSYRAKAEGIAE